MPCRVVIVDDHAESAEGLAELLATVGYEARVAPDGERAFELVEAFAPQAVVSDIGLPGMDGHELARRIRGLPGGGEMLLIALTGSRDDQTFAASAFDHWLVKPVEIDALVRLLGREGRNTRT